MDGLSASGMCHGLPHVTGDPMVYSGPIDLDALIDLDSLDTSVACHWTFLAFPNSSVNEHGVPADADAQRYIAAVQSAGVPVGIWRDTPVDGTAYAAVTHETIPQLHNAIEKLSQFSDSFAADLSERLFRESNAGGT
jgi:hypothetical protein